MRPAWGDVNARARGLSTHLLRSQELRALARQPDLPALAAAMTRNGIVPGPGAVTGDGSSLELAVRRWGAAALATLARWVGTRSAALPLVFDEEDRRSLRALVRGAAAQAPSEHRLAGLLPTPTLPERALQELASAPTVGAVGALLSAWRHPFARRLAEVAAQAEPDLFTVEQALGRAAAESATAAARRSGSRALQRHVAESIDLENGILALLLAGGGEEIEAAQLHLPGGMRLTRERFVAAIATRLPALAGRQLAHAFTGTPYAGAFESGGADPAHLEGELFQIRLRVLTRQVRLSPLEPTTTLWFALRLRAQLIDLQRIIWTVVLDAPRQPLVDRLLTAAA